MKVGHGRHVVLLGFIIDKFDGTDAGDVRKKKKSPVYDVLCDFFFQQRQYRLKTAFVAEIWMILMGLEIYLVTEKVGTS